MNILNLFAAMPGAVAQGLIWGIMAIGVYITYKILDLADLTVDGTMSTGGAVFVMVMLYENKNGEHPFNAWVAMLIAVLAGVLAGAATGILHTVLGIPAILAGILTQLGLYSINLRIMHNMSNQAITVNNYNLLISLRYIKSPLFDYSDGKFTMNTIFLIVLFLIVLIGLLYFFFGTEVGSAIRATGSNPNMSRAQGINTNLMKIFGLMLSNGIVALSSALYSQYQGFADINSGRGAIVIGLAAVIIAQVIFGKINCNFAFKLFFVAIGGVIYYMVLQVVLWLGLNANDLKLISACIVAAFLAIPYLKERYFPNLFKKGGSKNA